MKDLDNRTEVKLRQLRRYISEFFSEEVLSTLTIESEHLIDRFGQRLTALIDLPMEPLKTCREVARCEVPKGWFDHLRNEHFPNLFARRWPINYKTIEIPVEIEIGAVYPKLPEVFPRYGGNIRYVSLPKIAVYSERMEIPD
jgi:hypothetical protein